MADLYIGLAGQMLSGKSTAAKFYVEKFGAEHLRYASGGLLDDVLKILDLPLSRENQQNLGEMLRQQFGDDVMSKALLEKAKASAKRIVLLDGIRKRGELDIYRSLPNFKFIFITADLETRYKRLQGRDEKQGENILSLDQFKEKHVHDAESEIDQLKNYADYVVENNGSLQDFYAQLTKVITES